MQIILSQGADATATDLNLYDLAPSWDSFGNSKIETRTPATFGDSFDFALVSIIFPVHRAYEN